MLGGVKAKGPPSLPKSTSLPVIQDEVREEVSPDSVRLRKNLGSKYKYRSSYCEQEISSPDTITDTLITEVGSEPEAGRRPGEQSGRSKPASSREDIRRKLASFGEETIQEEDWSDPGTSNNLEICFINETAFDEEEEQVTINPLESYSDEEIGNHQQSVVIPRYVEVWSDLQ